MPRQASGRAPITLKVTPEFRKALQERADRDKHPYPTVLAATLLEKAVLPPDTGKEIISTAANAVISLYGKARAEPVLVCLRQALEEVSEVERVGGG